MKNVKRNLVVSLMLFSMIPLHEISAETIKAIIGQKFGIVQIRRSGSKQWQMLYKRDTIHENDTIRTEPDSYLRINFADNRQRSNRFQGSNIVIGENSEITITTSQYLEKRNRHIRIKVDKGGFLVTVPLKISKRLESGESKFEVETPGSICRVLNGVVWGEYEINNSEEGITQVIACSSYKGKVKVISKDEQGGSGITPPQDNVIIVSQKTGEEDYKIIPVSSDYYKKITALKSMWWDG